MVTPYLVPNSVLNLVSGLVALAVSYYAFRYQRITSSGFLRLISVGFMLLGIGLIAQASIFLSSALNVGRISDREALIWEATALYLVLQAAAYLLIAVGYTKRVQSGPVGAEQSGAVPAGALAIGSSPLLIGTHVLELSQLTIVVLVAFIVFQGLLAHGEQRNRLSLTVLGAFTLLLLAHAGLLAATLLTSGMLYVLGGVAQLVGFLLLLLFVLWSGRIGKT
jgi:hypothetical protein